MLALLESKPEVSSRELSAISLQYCARIAELRDAGAVISNRVAVQPNGVRHGFYRLIHRPPFLDQPVTSVKAKPNSPTSAPVSGSLFPETKPCEVQKFQYPD